MEIKELELHTSLLPQQSLNHLSFKKPSLNQASLPKLKSLLALRAPASCLGSSRTTLHTHINSAMAGGSRATKGGHTTAPATVTVWTWRCCRTARPGISAGRSRRIAQIAPSRGVNTAPGREFEACVGSALDIISGPSPSFQLDFGVPRPSTSALRRHDEHGGSLWACPRGRHAQPLPTVLGRTLRALISRHSDRPASALGVRPDGPVSSPPALHSQQDPTGLDRSGGPTRPGSALPHPRDGANPFSSMCP